MCSSMASRWLTIKWHNALTQPVFQKFLFLCFICCCTNHSISFGDGTNAFFSIWQKNIQMVQENKKQYWLSLDEVSLKVFIFFMNHMNLKINKNYNKNPSIWGIIIKWYYEKIHSFNSHFQLGDFNKNIFHWNAENWWIVKKH